MLAIMTLTGCSYLHTLYAPLSSAPEPDRALWPCFQSTYLDTTISCNVPLSRKYPSIFVHEPEVTDGRSMAAFGLEDVLSNQYDVDYGYGVPELTVTLMIGRCELKQNGGTDIQMLADYCASRVPKDQRITQEIIPNNGTAWVHVKYLEATPSQGDVVLKDSYLTLLSETRYLHLSGRYGTMALNAEWLASRRKVTEDILRSVRIEKTQKAK